MRLILGVHQEGQKNFFWISPPTFRQLYSNDRNTGNLI